MKIQQKSQYTYKTSKGRDLKFTLFPPFALAISSQPRRTGKTLIDEKQIQLTLDAFLNDFNKVVNDPEQRKILLGTGYARYNRNNQEMAITIIETIVKTRRNGIKRKRHATTVKICSNRVKL